MPIRLLDPVTVGHIAAGEVIERPVSVVKELVENALDASATRIDVRVRGGGVEEIEVSDNGVGIPASQLALALTRHATSKLERAEDLARIVTLGFRGEGLASIASVAEVTVCSRTRDAEIGTAVDAFEEQVSEPYPCPAPLGTRVVARNLFGHVPVRREYLRSASAEFTRIASWLSTMALAYPNVAFSLVHDERETFRFAEGDVLALRLAHVFGARAADALLPLVPMPNLHEIGVAGAISQPGHDRPDRRMQLLFVNGRLLRSTALAGAWTAAYSTFAMVGRHAYGALFLDLPPDQVDPNVHPTKSDVRLRYDRGVFEAVKATMHKTLAEHARSRMVAAFAAPLGEIVPPPPPDERTVESPAFSFAPAATIVAPAQTLRILAQLDETFIIATDGRALVLVDQHAAHERVAYELIESYARTRAPVSEPLLVPYAFELDAARADALERALGELAAGGLEIEPFGPNAFRVLATPAGFLSPLRTGQRKLDIDDLLDDLILDVRGLSAYEKVYASLACHAVVRAGDRMQLAEMSELLARLERCENPMHCPHGRPTIVRLEPDAMARLFKRM